MRRTHKKELESLRLEKDLMLKEEVKATQAGRSKVKKSKIIEVL